MKIFSKLKLALIIPDTHAPYHHYKAYSLMIKVARSLPLDEIVLLGDFADFYSVMTHPKSPSVNQDLSKEIEAVNAKLDELDSFDCKKVFIEGNHEYRLERFISAKCPELFSVTEIKRLLNMDKRLNWKWIDYAPSQQHRILGSKLIARHEPSASNAKSSISKSMQNVVYGHIHRIEESYAVSLDGTEYVNFSCGWLGDKRKNEIYGYVKNHHQWQLGFSLVYVDSKTGNFYHNIIHILEHGKTVSCVVNGVYYEA